MSVYYNEHDPAKAEWLRELIRLGAIANGVVDERSIKEVQSSDVAGFTQRHWFAGIGVWSYSLRLAGWPDDRACDTGSCPCPSFSTAGKGGGFSDPRHLWPDWFRPLRKLLPPVVFGEQVESAIGHGWLDLVQTDMEGENYAVGKAVLTAAGVGAPHIRQRLYFVAYHNSEGHWRTRLRDSEQAEVGRVQLAHSSQLVYPESFGRERRKDDEDRGRRERSSGLAGSDGELAHTEGHAGNGDRIQEPRWEPTEPHGPVAEAGTPEFLGYSPLFMRRPSSDESGPGGDEQIEAGGPGVHGGSSALAVHRRDADWLLCTDGKWRTTQSFISPLDDGVAGDLGLRRVLGRDQFTLSPLIAKAKARGMRLKGYGDAIVAPLAAEFIKSVMEVIG